MEAKRYARINKIMEIEDWAGEDDDEWVVDRDGDHVMPQVELMMVRRRRRATWKPMCAWMSQGWRRTNCSPVQNYTQGRLVL